MVGGGRGRGRTGGAQGGRGLPGLWQGGAGDSTGAAGRAHDPRPTGARGRRDAAPKRNAPASSASRSEPLSQYSSTSRTWQRGVGWGLGGRLSVQWRWPETVGRGSERLPQCSSTSRTWQRVGVQERSRLDMTGMAAMAQGCAVSLWHHTGLRRAQGWGKHPQEVAAAGATKARPWAQSGDDWHHQGPAPERRPLLARPRHERRRMAAAAGQGLGGGGHTS